MEFNCSLFALTSSPLDSLDAHSRVRFRVITVVSRGRVLEDSLTCALVIDYPVTITSIYRCTIIMVCD